MIHSLIPVHIDSSIDRIDRNLRYCDMCNLDVLGDEYHVFFECANPDIVTLCQQCIPRYYLQNPSMLN